MTDTQLPRAISTLFCNNKVEQLQDNICSIKIGQFAEKLALLCQKEKQKSVKKLFSHFLGSHKSDGLTSTK